MNVLLREPSIADAEAIARVHTDSWRETYAGIFPETFFDAEALARRVGLWVNSIGNPEPGAATLVAESDGEIIGFARAGRSRGDDVPRDRELYLLYVLSAAHGCGVGQGLLDGVLGDDPALLWVSEGNSRALAFYTRNGFVPDGEEKGIPYVPGRSEIRLVR